MRYCGPKGIPLSVFLAWPSTDQAAALAWQDHEARRCAKCGTHPNDYDPESGGRRHAWHPAIEVCEGCAASERGHEIYGADLQHHGARVVLTTEAPPPPVRVDES